MKINNRLNKSKILKKETVQKLNMKVGKKVIKLRGVNYTKCDDFFNYSKKTYREYVSFPIYFSVGEKFLKLLFRFRLTKLSEMFIHDIRRLHVET